jgi:hypothetical protein
LSIPMKTQSRNLIIRLALLAGAMGAAYFMGRAPGLAAKWEGAWPAAWRHFISPLAPSLVVASKKSPAQKQGEPAKLISLKEATDRIAQIKSGTPYLTHEEQWAAYEDIVQHLSAADRVALFNLAKDMPDDFEFKGLLLDQLIHSISGTDHNPVLALSLCKSMPMAFQDSELSNILEQLAQTDPKLALSELGKLSPGTDKDYAYGSVFYQLAHPNPVTAAALAAALPPGSERDRAIEEVSRAWENKDPPAAINWLLSLPNHETSLINLFQQIVNYQPDLVMSYLDKIPELAQDTGLIEEISTALATSTTPDFNPNTALDLANRIPAGATYSVTINNIFSNLSFLDPSTAAGLLDKITDPRTRQEQITTLATNWGAEDPVSAVAWANSLMGADAGSRNVVLQKVISSWATVDPASAAAYIQNSPNSEALLSIAPEIAQTWVSPAPLNLSSSRPQSPYESSPEAWTGSDPQAALAWVNTLPDSDAKNQALNNVLVVMAAANFTGAWDDAANLPDSANRNSILTNLVGAEVSHDPEQAAAAIAQLPTDATQVSAATTVATTWIQQDPVAATDWINSLPEGGVRDASVQPLIASLASQSPASAVTWANTLTNSTLRATQLQTVLTGWAAKNPADAIAAAQSANLTDAQRAALIQSLAKITTVVK